MTHVEVADLVAVASRALGTTDAEALALVDLQAAERALAEARRSGKGLGPDGEAAALLASLIRHRPLSVGNEQVAWLAMLQVLALEGWEVDPPEPEAILRVVSEVRSGEIDGAALASWLCPRMRRRGRVGRREGAGMFGQRRRRSGEGGGRMFARFTKRAREVVVLAQEEARRLGHNYVGTEHLLLGLLVEGEGVAAKALGALEVSLEETRRRIEGIIGQGAGTPSGSIPFTPRSKKVLELSLGEALRLGHNYVGTEHLLLGLLVEGEGVAAQVLEERGLGLEQVRQAVVGLLAGWTPPARADEPRAEEPEDPARRRERLLVELGWVLDEPERLRGEVERLRALLRRHGIDPDSEGSSQSA